jgi:hypothetical protein
MAQIVVAAIAVAPVMAGRPRQRFAWRQFPKQWLVRPISIAAASWRGVVDGLDKTAETASHFVGALSRSPAHPVNMTANSRIMILIRAFYANSVLLSGLPWTSKKPSIYWPNYRPWFVRSVWRGQWGALHHI